MYTKIYAPIIEIKFFFLAQQANHVVYVLSLHVSGFAFEKFLSFLVVQQFYFKHLHNVLCFTDIRL